MSDSIGPIPIPDPPVIGAFPLTSAQKGPDYGSGYDYQPPVAVHVFEQDGLQTEQRFVLGSGARRFRVTRDHLTRTEYDALKTHWTQAQGQYAQFPYTQFGPTGIVDPSKGPKIQAETFNVRYENPNLSFDQLVSMLTGNPGVTLLEIPGPAAPYTSVAQVVRFPMPPGWADSTFRDALSTETQHVIPLVTIQPRTPAPTALVPNPAAPAPVYISNQRVTIDGITYLPRLVSWGGISQTIGESSDGASFTLGNADGVFVQWANVVNLLHASVQFALFHVESKYLCLPWAGYAQPWSFDPNGTFTLPASDGTFELGLAYPTRMLTRTCWKVYKGRFCPSTSSFTDCPKDFDSCTARGVPHSFGGAVVQAATVAIMDNTTGVWGWGRSSMLSVTVSNDSVYQRPVQEVWTDEAMPVTCDVLAGRDEDTFYAALGIVSEGPIGSYNPDLYQQRLDNQPPQDPKHYLGWRGIIGTDPAMPTDFLGIDQAPWLPNIPPGPPPPTWAGGLAFAEIRRTDPKGLQLSAVSDHAMTVSVMQGVGGWVWTAPGTRVWTPGLSNTVWVAVNVYLRALGLRCDPTNQDRVPVATMEQHFDVNQCIAAGTICDLIVNKIIGDPTVTEKQYPFRAVIKERKPVKDWLTEILNGCLGFWTFVNGKLWIGIRVDASVRAENAYSQAHIKWKSLQVTPVKPNFNWLTVQFGDEEFAWQLNNITVYDIDHASYLGTGDSPQYMASTMSYVGVSNKSQAARLCTTRLREELGGVGPVEQLNARNFQFSTTILSLQTMVGDVISLEHPWFPAGIAKGRVTSWRLNPDFSIDIQATAVTDDMYDYDAEGGPKPTDVTAPPLPGPYSPSPTGLVWMPNHTPPFPNDPLYPAPTERTFDLVQDYTITKDGVWIPELIVTGEMLINQFVSITQPRIAGAALAAGGALNGPLGVYIAVSVHDGASHPAVPSNTTATWIPAGQVNQKITLELSAPLGLPPDGSGAWAGWDLWAGTDTRAMAWQTTGAGALPLTLDLAGPLLQMTKGMPSGAASGIEAQVKGVVHAGVAGLSVTGVTAPNIIQCNDARGSGDPWIGRIVSALADYTDGDAPLWNFTVTAFNAATGEFTVNPPWPPDDPVDINDVLIIRSRADRVSADLATVTDFEWNNSIGRAQFGANGLAPGAEVGNIARILRGTGQGQYRSISANDELTFTVSPPWTVAPDLTSVIIIEDPTWEYSAESSDLQVNANGAVVSVRVAVANLANRVALVAGFLVDKQGNLSAESLTPMREIWVFGKPPTVRTVGPQANDPATSAPWAAVAEDQTIRVDNSANDVNILLPPLAVYHGRTLYVVPDPAGAFNAIVNSAPGETYWDGSTQITIAPGETSRITAGGS